MSVGGLAFCWGRLRTMKLVKLLTNRDVAALEHSINRELRADKDLRFLGLTMCANGTVGVVAHKSVLPGTMEIVAQEAATTEAKPAAKPAKKSSKKTKA